jgi:geranylgeranyl diphosphate synthase type II
MNFTHHQELIERELQRIAEDCGNNTLYDPVKYILSLGGKRLRPALTLVTCELYNQNVNKALPAAAAFEVFHNFTLMHDDIMDHAPLRRGKQTVHEKWNVNQAILSGDAMFVLSVQLIAKSDPAVMPELLNLFNKTALEVCEGQELDMAFENREDVSIPEYIEMIRLKTSVLVAACMAAGAIAAGAGASEAKGCYDFGENLGIAFQLHDDYLDTFGEAGKTGKLSGGDILADKKTFLLIRALEKAQDSDISLIKSLFGRQNSSTEKVTTIRNIFLENAIDKELLALADDYYNKALQALENLHISHSGKEVLKRFASTLMARDH